MCIENKMGAELRGSGQRLYQGLGAHRADGLIEEEKLGSSAFHLIFAGKAPSLASSLVPITAGGRKRNKEKCWH